MIKLFRNIRKNLLNEGNKTKYFKYAIGEIFLVVFGILIALQINNWNEDRKARIEERYVLVQLESEFKNNLKQLDEKIAIREKMIHASLQLLAYKDNPSLRNNDSIIKQITHTISAPTFDPIVNDLISSGKLKLLQNERLKQLLSLWTSEIIQVTEDEVTWRKLATEFYSPFLKEHDFYRTILANFWKTNQVNRFLIDKDQKTSLQLTKSKSTEDISKLLDEISFENHLADCITWNKLINLQSETLRNRIVEILTLLQKELKVNQ